MPVHDLSKKTRIPSKAHVPTTPAVATQPTTPVTAPVPGNVEVDAQGRGAAAAHKALGLLDAGAHKAAGAGAKAAVHGLSFMERTTRTLRKGVLVALTGIAVLGGMGPTTSPFTRAVQTHTRLETTAKDTTRTVNQEHRGPRALPDVLILLDKWETLAATNPDFTVDGGRVNDLLAKALLPQVPTPGQDLVALSKASLSKETLDKLTSVLDNSRFKLAPDARTTLETVVGRGAVIVATAGGTIAASDGKLSVVGDQSGGPAGQGKITVKGAPGAQVEVINLSTIPTKRLHSDDTFVLGTIGADGTFAGSTEMSPGDVIRVRTKAADGTASAFLDFKATGFGADTRQAEAALFRIGLTDQGNGRIGVANINSSRPVSEPGAVMRFINQRTQESTDIVFDKNGTFFDGTTLPGKTGDTFSIRVTDGVNDKDLQTEISTLTVREAGKPSTNTFDLKDPTVHHDEADSAGKSRFALERFTGPLFDATGAEYTDVTQGQLGDCYFPSSIASIAFHKPGTFEKVIEQKRETNAVTGEESVWYEVHFKEKDWSTGKFKDVVQKVDGDLYLRSWGGPLYGSDDGVRDPDKMELWFSILEKAYAQWKGESYEAIGNGGQMDQVFEDILGVSTSSMSVYNKDAVWKQIQTNVDKHRPIGAGTHGDDQEALYANTGVYADHAYSILGYKTEGGTQYVQLRNPWGESEPFPGDGKNDGIFFLKLDDFMKLYSTVYFATADK